MFLKKISFIGNFDNDTKGPNRFVNSLHCSNKKTVKLNSFVCKYLFVVGPSLPLLVIHLLKSIGFVIIYRVDGVILFENDLKDRRLDKSMLKYSRSIESNQAIYKTLLTVNGIIYQSQFSRNLIHSFYPDLKNKANTVIYNATSFSSSFSARRANNSSEINLLFLYKEKFSLIFLELLDIIKSCSHVFNSRAINKTITFTIVGDIGPSNRTKIMSLRDSVCPSVKIKNISCLDKNEMNEVFINSDILLSLKPYDWCPNAVLEAGNTNTFTIYLEPSGVSEITTFPSYSVDAQGLNFIGQPGITSIVQKICDYVYEDLVVHDDSTNSTSNSLRSTVDLYLDFATSLT